MTRRYVSSRRARRGGGRALRPEITRARPVRPPPTATLEADDTRDAELRHELAAVIGYLTRRAGEAETEQGRRALLSDALILAATLGPGPLCAWLVRSIGEEEVATALEAVDRGAASGALLRAATLRHLEEADHAADMAGGARVPFPRRP